MMDIFIIVLIICLIIISVPVVICKIMIHKCDKDIAKYNKDIAKYNAELERIEAERDKNRAEIEQLEKEIMDIEQGQAFINKWRDELIELIGTNYNHPIWKEYNELSDEVKEVISIACRQVTVIEYRGE